MKRLVYISKLNEEAGTEAAEHILKMTGKQPMLFLLPMIQQLFIV